MITTVEIKEYSRIDADDNTLQLMLDSASSHFESKGIKEEYLTGKDIDRMNLGLLMLVDHWYNNRGAYTDKNLYQIPMGVNSIIFGLKLTCQKYLDEQVV